MLVKFYPTRVGALISWCFSELRSARQRSAKFQRMVRDVGLLAAARRARDGIAFRLARAQHLTDRGQFPKPSQCWSERSPHARAIRTIILRLAPRTICAAHSGMP